MKTKKTEAVVSRKKEYANPWFYVVKEKIRYPNGKVNDYYILSRNNYFVCIVAVKDNHILILRQWRPAKKDYNWEIPMGAINEGETPIKAAYREFEEETGCKAGKMIKLAEFYVGLGHSDQKGLVYLCESYESLKKKTAEQQEEMIELFELTLDTFDAMIKNGEVVDGPTLASYMFYKNRKENL